MEEICEGAFKHCTELEYAIFPSNSKCRKLGAYSFSGCRALYFFIGRPLLEEIGENAFYKTSVRFYDEVYWQIHHNEYNSNPRSRINIEAPISLRSITDNPNINFSDNHPFIQRDKCGYNIWNSTIIRGSIKRRHVLIRSSVERIGKNSFIKSILVSVIIPASVRVIEESAFKECRYLRWIRFSSDSKLIEIKKNAFSSCSSIRKLTFPSSLRIIRESFCYCNNLVEVTFPHDSQLIRIEAAFFKTKIKHLYLPPTVREIDSIHKGMYMLESINLNSESYESNSERNAIFSKDGSELVCAFNRKIFFQIPRTVRIIKKSAFDGYSFKLYMKKLIIPKSVEVIEAGVFSNSRLDVIEFEEGSKLKELNPNAFPRLDSLIINNENFVQLENGVVMSLNPRGIVFAPKDLKEIEIDENVEIINSYAFSGCPIRKLNFPKSLKKIYRGAFINSKLEEITFEEGTELDVIDQDSFTELSVKRIKLPIIKRTADQSLKGIGFIHNYCVEDIVCPVPSIHAIAKICLRYNKIEFI